MNETPGIRQGEKPGRVEDALNLNAEMLKRFSGSSGQTLGPDGETLEQTICGILISLGNDLAFYRGKDQLLTSEAITRVSGLFIQGLAIHGIFLRKEDMARAEAMAKPVGIVRRER